MIEELLEFSKRIAIDAGEILKKYFSSKKSKLNERLKRPRNVLTEADLEREKFIRKEIEKKYPEHEIVGEELIRREGKKFRWLVDPLDGTTNFASGIPHWAVSIAVCDFRGEAAGVIYDPLREEMFFAGRGLGSWRGSERIKVSKESKLEDALAATGFGAMRGTKPDLNCIERFKRVLIEVKGVRRIGSAALDLAYVAAGRFEFFFEDGLGPWDIAAGALIVREAGGVTIDYDAGDEYLSKGSIIAGNEKIVRKAVKLIRGKE